MEAHSFPRHPPIFRRKKGGRLRASTLTRFFPQFSELSCSVVKRGTEKAAVHGGPQFSEVSADFSPQKAAACEPQPCHDFSRNFPGFCALVSDGEPRRPLCSAAHSFPRYPPIFRRKRRPAIYPAIFRENRSQLFNSQRLVQHKASTSRRVYRPEKTFTARYWPENQWVA